MIQVCHCLRCGHDWGSRKLQRPERCSRCGRKYWWREKRKPKEKTKSVTTIGRPRKYRVDLLKVGQTMTLEYTLGAVVSMKQAIHAFSVRSGRIFAVHEKPEGLKVTRIE